MNKTWREESTEIIIVNWSLTQISISMSQCLGWMCANRVWGVRLYFPGSPKSACLCLFGSTFPLLSQDSPCSFSTTNWARECNLSPCKKQTEQTHSRKQQHREEQTWARWPRFIHSLPLHRVLPSRLIPGTGRIKILLQEYWSQAVPFLCFLLCTLLGRGKELE